MNVPVRMSNLMLKWALIVVFLTLPVPLLAQTPMPTLYISIGFDGADPPYSLADASILAGQTDAFIQQNSAGQRTVPATITTWLHAALGTSTCQTGAIVQAAKQAAEVAGYDVSVTAAPHLVIFFSYRPECYFFQGTASPPYFLSDGTQLFAGLSLINGVTSTHVVLHEFGHQLASPALAEGDVLECGSVVLGSRETCTRLVYGDCLTMMGDSYGNYYGGCQGAFGLYNLTELAVLHWIDAPNFPSTLTPVSDGDYFIEPIGQTTGAWHGLRFPRPDGRTLSVEHRARTGWDFQTPVPNGIYLTLQEYGQDYLLDAHPGTGQYSLQLTESWTTPEGITLTVLTADETGATVRVTGLGTAQPIDCVQGDWYTVSTTTTTSDWTTVGDHQERAITTTTIQQRDTLMEPANGGTACGPSSQTMVTTTTETRPLPDTVAPVVTLNVTRSGKSGNYTVSVSATDNIGVVGLILTVDGVVRSPGSMSLSKNGTHTFVGTATDAAGNVGTVKVVK